MTTLARCKRPPPRWKAGERVRQILSQAVLAAGPGSGSRTSVAVHHATLPWRGKPMIIFGTRGITYSKDKGEFHCPECGTERRYNHKRVRRFFTLYFIPLIPLNLLGEFVECETCQSTYKPEVLTYDPAAGAAELEAEYHHAVKQVMIGLMIADGSADDEEVRKIAELYQQLTKSEITDAQIRSEAAQTDADGSSIRARLQEMTPRLNDHGKELVIRAAIMVAAADGEFHQDELDLIASFGDAMGMTPAHLRGVMDSMHSSA
jgi:tellurite resistance protein/predicted RNA-binding Zn-ribbon protein involved in translation (DUF1610 family)